MIWWFNDLGAMSFIGCLTIVTLVMLLTLSVVTICVWLFMQDYSGLTNSSKTLASIIIVFVASMLLLTVHNSLLLLLIAWDGLGLSSYLLVVHYVNHSSSGGGMVTVMSNRVGDGLLVWWSAVVLWSGSLSSTIMECCLLLIFVCFTKSAQVPFSAWLPQAMAAPTPVSSLVHSSTLVVAGVWLLLLYNSHFTLSLLSVLVLGGSFTSFVAGVSALAERDVKRLVALSTLSQMGLLVTSVGCGLWYMAWLHVMTHAFLKASLFISVGQSMLVLSSAQDMRDHTSASSNSAFLSMSDFLSLLGLSGIGLTSGLVTKEPLVELSLTLSISVLALLFTLISVALTPAYCVRLAWVKFQVTLYNVYGFSRSWLGVSAPLFLALLGVVWCGWLEFNLCSLPIISLYEDKLMISCVVLCGVALGMISVGSWGMAQAMLGTEWFVGWLSSFSSKSLRSIDMVWSNWLTLSFFTSVNKFLINMVVYLTYSRYWMFYMVLFLMWFCLLI